MLYIFLSLFILLSSIATFNKIKVFNIFIFTSLVIVCVYFPAIRDTRVGTDSLMYANYVDWNLSLFDYSSYFEFGNAIIYRIVIDWFSSEYQYVFIFYAILTNLFLVLSVFKISKNIYLSMLCILCFQSIYFAQFNIMRQVLAFSIFLYAMSFMLNKENRKFYFWLIISIFFHSSAVVGIFFPILYRMVKRNFLFPVVLFNSGVILVAIIFNTLISILSSFGGYFGKYAAYINYNNEKSVGINLFVLNFIFILVIFLISNKKFSNSVEYRLYVFLASIMLSIQFSVAFLNMSEQVFGRFSIYFFSGIFFLLPYACMALNRNIRPIFCMFITLFLLVYLYIFIYVLGIHGVFPNLLLSLS